MIKSTLFAQWNFMRLLRLLIGGSIVVQAYYTTDLWLGLAGLLFTGMAIFNVGCCGTNGCNTNIKNKTITHKTETVSYEEVV